MTRHTKSSRSAFELSRVCVRWTAADTMDITRGEAFVIDKRTIRIYSKVIQISNASGRRPQHRIASHAKAPVAINIDEAEAAAGPLALLE